MHWRGKGGTIRARECLLLAAAVCLLAFPAFSDSLSQARQARIFGTEAQEKKAGTQKDPEKEEMRQKAILYNQSIRREQQAGYAG